MRGIRTTRSFWLLQLGGWTFYGLATFLTFLPAVEAGAWAGLFQFKVLARPAAGIVVSSLMALGYRRLDEGDVPGSVVAGVGALGSIAGGLAWLALSGLLVHPFRPDVHPLLLPWAPHVVLEYVFVMLAWSAAFFGIRAWSRSRDRERRAAEAESRAAEARLAMLDEQVNPHFLFNALTSLRGMIRRDPERAEHTVTRLAAFLRSTLTRPTAREVPLREELDVVGAYLDVERARLGDTLEVEWSVEPEAREVSVPAFLLYPLVDNAVKHGRSPPGRSLRIEIRARTEDGELVLEVTNPGDLVDTDGPGRPPGTGTGLKNVRERLAHARPEGHALDLEDGEDGVVARVRMEARRGDDRVSA